MRQERTPVAEVRSGGPLHPDLAESCRSALNSSSDAIVVGLEGLTQAHRKTIAELAAMHRLPAIYGGREFVDAGGLIFYGPSFTEIYRRAATYLDRIFRGAKPADLPIEQPTKFELVINALAARGLGLDIPPSLLARAVDVIEQISGEGRPAARSSV